MKDPIGSDIAEAKIKEAIRKGELKNLQGEGKPLVLQNENPLLTPEERMAYKVMKTLGLTSEEACLKKEMDELKEQIRNCNDEKKIKSLKKQLQEKSIWYNILLEKRRV